MDKVWIQAVLSTESISTEATKIVNGVGIMIDDLEVQTALFCLKTIKDNQSTITFYTGYT